MNENIVREQIIELFKEKSYGRKIFFDDNLFGINNHFTYLDIAYILLEIEIKFNIQIDEFIENIGNDDFSYTINNFVNNVIILM